MPSAAPVASMEIAAPRLVAAERKVEAAPPGRSTAEKRVFSAVKGRVESHQPETPNPLHQAVMDVMDYATDWPPDTEFSGGSITTKVGSNPNAPTEVSYRILRIDKNGDFIGVGFTGTETTLKRADLVAETIDERIPKTPDGSIDIVALQKAVPDEPTRNYLIAFFSAQKRGQPQIGEVADRAIVTETARSMGYLMSDDIVHLASELINPETQKPYITPEEAKQITNPPATDAEKKPLSPAATELMGKLGVEPILDREHAADALLSLGIVTNSGQLEHRRYSLAQRRKSLEGTMDKTFGTESGSSETKEAFQKRSTAEHAEFDAITAQLEEIENLQKLTGRGEWDVLGVYMEGAEEGAASTDKKDYLLKNTLNPNKVLSQDQLRDIDKSYDEWVKETDLKEKKKKQKEFFRKLIMGTGLGLGGLAAFNVWRASKKDEK